MLPIESGIYILGYECNIQGYFMKLKNKVAVVTGAGRGIGRAIALAFAKEGAKVVVNSLHREHADSVAAEIKKAGRDFLQ